MIQNCPVTHYTVINAYKVFWADLVGLRGKIVRKDPTRI